MEKYSLGANFILLFILLVVGFFYKGALQENQRLEMALKIELSNTKILNEALEAQNEAYRALEVKSSKPPPTLNTIKEIYIKDKTCQSELEAYKSLFLELGKSP
ncbi:hypothetical protein B6S12_05020 [Helicobacter valdiviensis]|uniref:Uncharacterized protein n=1 Tax=Helicobacter valdiviensis TaxID=1458358 RepID=A0A2W6PNA0_9HELI|nr:hypothetical protein [Helicobacter valdiviensis]PZT48183.1 hypothetical protein B6S12_05020 [Helicobacter valdiviensis]